MWDRLKCLFKRHNWEYRAIGAVYMCSRCGKVKNSEWHKK